MADQNLVNVVSLVRQLQPALEHRDRAKLVEIIEQLVAARAAMGEQWEALALLAANHGELTLARKAFELFVDAHEGQPAAQYRMAGLFAHIGAWRDAYELLCTLSADIPSPVEHAYSRGISALYLGEIGEARRQLERAVRMAPRMGSAWYSLSLATDLTEDTKLAESLIAGARAMNDSYPLESAAYNHALGKLHAAQGEHDLAFAAFARGANSLKSVMPYDREADQRSAGAAIKGYSAERIASIAATQSEATARTIFVTGLPRSGTTLVQQILTSHSEVSDGAEIGRLDLLMEEIGGQSWPALRHYVEAQGAAQAARLWHHWIEQRFPGSRRIVDKTVNSSRFLGLIAALLPEAPLVWVTRDPLDRAWSCYRTYFPQSMPWSNDLQDIAFHFRLEDQLLAQWQQILGERLLVLPYESLVAAPEQWIRRLLDHCGLTEEAQAFAPHENKGLAATSSVQQVRQPINSGGIGSSMPYRDQLQPFIRAYFG